MHAERTKVFARTPHDGVVAALVQHDAAARVVVGHVVLHQQVVAPLGRDDAVVAWCTTKNTRKIRMVGDAALFDVGPIERRPVGFIFLSME